MHTDHIQSEDVSVLLQICLMHRIIAIYLLRAITRPGEIDYYFLVRLQICICAANISIREMFLLRINPTKYRERNLWRTLKTLSIWCFRFFFILLFQNHTYIFLVAQFKTRIYF